VKINEMETKKRIQRINTTKDWFFGKKNKIDKHFAKIRREKIQIHKN
jgi:hypothetical protein